MDDYKDSLILPSTEFSMKANLPTKEPAFLKFWEDNDIYNKSNKFHEEEFILHDGPPYANGDIHMGTAMNKILKDIILKYKRLCGYDCEYIPGWDTHGLPIELKALKEYKCETKLDIRKKSKEVALHYIDIQREEFKRLGVFAYWNDPYYTLKPEYEAKELFALADLVEKDLVYRGLKPVYWCPDCRTALAAGEIEYHNDKVNSIYIAYPFISSIETLEKYDIYALAWTTTTWTIPASMGISVNPSFEYSFFKENGTKRVFLFAKDRYDSVIKDTNLNLSKNPLLTIKGYELERKEIKHPIYDNTKLIFMLADYVDLETGTGCVHTAPGHGIDDYETGIKYNLKIQSDVLPNGNFVSNLFLFGGMSLEEGTNAILNKLKEHNTLIATKEIKHEYPHCWRCKKPVIFRATDQWFIDVDKFKSKVLEAINNDVEWIPKWGKDRIYNMVSNRSDWCISRQRTWGVPIPAIKCKDCKHIHINPLYIRLLAEKVKNYQDGTDIWWEESLEELFGKIKCPNCGSYNVEKDDNILDVWFDSGISHIAAMEEDTDIDLYLEGSDQHRGWFQSSLLTSIALNNKPPYKQVLTHGFILDDKGRKMSKSLGNVILPEEIIKESGADILRLWVATTDYQNDVKISKRILSTSTSEIYKKIRNTFRFMLGNLSDYKTFIPDCDKFSKLDIYIINKANDLSTSVSRDYDNFNFNTVITKIYNFFVNDLSSFYLDICKDRLYVEARDSQLRRYSQFTLLYLCKMFVKILAPILSFTMEEVWQELRKIDPTITESVFLSRFIKIYYAYHIQDQWNEMLSLRKLVNECLETYRSKDMIKSSLEASVQVIKTKYDKLYNSKFTNEEIAEILNVSRFEWTNKLTYSNQYVNEVSVEFQLGNRCPRCWKYMDSTDENGLCSRCHDVMKSL